MAVFEFQCPKGHITELFVPLSERPAEVLCETADCGFMAPYVLSATPTTFRQMDRHAFKRRGR